MTDAPDIATYSREIQSSVVVNYQGKKYLTPTRSLRERLAPENNQRSIFISPSSFSTVTAGQQGPSTFNFQLNSLGVTFAEDVYLEMTVENTTGSTAAINNFHSFLDRVEINVGGGGGVAEQSGTQFLYAQPMFYQELDRAVAAGSFEQIAKNIGISSTLASGVFPPLYGASNPLAAGEEVLALLRIPEPLSQTELPVSLSDTNYSMRIFFTSNPANYGAAITAGDIALKDIRLHVRGLRLNERLHTLLAQRCRLAPSVYPCCYYRRFYTSGVVLSAGAQSLNTFLSSTGWNYNLRCFWASAVEGLPTFQPLITTLGDGLAQAAVYSQMAGNYVLQSESGGKVGVTKTYMADRQPWSPLPRLAVYDYANITDVVGCAKNGASGAAFRVNSNDLQWQLTSLESATRVWWQLSLTAGFATFQDGSVGIRFFEV